MKYVALAYKLPFTNEPITRCSSKSGFDSSELNYFAKDLAVIKKTVYMLI